MDKSSVEINRRKPAGLALTAGIVAFVMAGTSVALSTYLAPRVGNLSTAFLSIPGALLVLVPLAWPVLRKPQAFRPTPRALVPCVLQALGGVVVFRLMTTWASHTTSLGVAGIVFATGPVVLALGGALFFKDSLRWKDGVALVLASAGLLLLRSDKTMAASPEGLLFLFVAVLGEAAMSLIRRRGGESLLDYRVNALYTIVCALVLLTPFAMVEWATQGFPALDGETVLLFLFYGVGSTAIGYISWSFAAARLSSVVIGLCSAAAPLTTLVVSVLVFRESPGMAALVGWAVALAGVLLCVLSVGGYQRSPVRP